MTYEELLEVARSRDEIVGAYVLGSRGRDFMVDGRSDWDVCVVLASREAREEFERESPLPDWTADELLPLLDRVLAGEREAQHELFRRIEEPARREGFGDVVDGWEPDLEWLRGRGEFRA